MTSSWRVVDVSRNDSEHSIDFQDASCRVSTIHADMELRLCTFCTVMLSQNHR